MNLILDAKGWRFCLPIVVVAIAAGLVHFTIGWTPVISLSVGILFFLAVAVGILWQHFYERNS